jgi:hypothetical protein
VTAENFDPDLDLVDEVGIDSMDLATVAWCCGMNTVCASMKTIIPNSPTFA